MLGRDAPDLRRRVVRQREPAVALPAAALHRGVGAADGALGRFVRAARHPPPGGPHRRQRAPAEPPDGAPAAGTDLPRDPAARLPPRRARAPRPDLWIRNRSVTRSRPWARGLRLG